MNSKFMQYMYFNWKLTKMYKCIARSLIVYVSMNQEQRVGYSYNVEMIMSVLFSHLFHFLLSLAMGWVKAVKKVELQVHRYQ